MEKIADYIERNIEHVSALILGYALIVGSFIVSYESVFKLIKSTPLIIITLVIINLVWTLVWFKIRRLPRNDVNKIGLVISIETESDKQKLRIENDFISRLNLLIDTYQLNDTVNVIHLKARKASFVNEVLKDYARKKFQLSKPKKRGDAELAKKRFLKVKDQIGAHFYVYGLVKERLDVENKYFLSLDGWWFIILYQRKLNQFFNVNF